MKKSKFHERRFFFFFFFFFFKPKNVFSEEITTDFENRLEHQVNIIVCAYLDFDLLVHLLLSNVSPVCNLKFPSISSTFGFGAKM